MQVIDKTFERGQRTVSPEDLAQTLHNLVPQIMGNIRQHLRTAEELQLRGGQFRMLMAIQTCKVMSISQVAELMGLTLPSASKIADELETLHMVRRQADPADRRRVLLSLTAPGRSALKTFSRAVQKHLSETFRSLTLPERTFLMCSLEMLRSLFGAKTEAAALTPALHTRQSAFMTKIKFETRSDSYNKVSS